MAQTLEIFANEAEFLYYWLPPATKEIRWWKIGTGFRTQMLTLLGLAQEFGEQFRLSKRELAMVDFHDLEQFALRLLWDTKENRPTKIAQEWREKLRFVFVDEYQDINAAQDKIIQALGRDLQMEPFSGRRRQASIYRFRLANPQSFKLRARVAQ